MRLIVAIALLSNSTRIIISHNHPSNRLTPSSQDGEITQKIKAAAELFDIQLADHIIYTKNGYYSFADEGEL